MGNPPSGKGRGVCSFPFRRGSPRALSWCPPPGPRATEPRGRILTCQTRPGRVYNSPALAPGAAASPALRWDPATLPAPAARALTLTLSRSTRAHTQTRALPLCTRAHTLARCHLHTRARTHKRTLPRSLSPTRATLTRARSHAGPLTLQGRRHRRRERREDPRPSHG